MNEKIRGFKPTRLTVDETTGVTHIEAAEPLEDLPEVPVEPQTSSGYKDHYQYYEPSEGSGGLPAVICTCGAKKHHLRMKVLATWSKKHFEKTGHNTRKASS